MRVGLPKPLPENVKLTRQQAAMRDGYMKAVAAGSKALIAKTRPKYLTELFGGKPVKPKQKMLLDKRSQAHSDSYPGPDAFSAKVVLTPEMDCLKVDVDVTDASFSTAMPPGRPWECSSVELFVSPSGLDDDILHIYAVPDGPEDEPQVSGIIVNRGEADLGDLKSSWKRTAAGYTMSLAVPYSTMPSYQAGWRVLPVEVAVNTNGAKGQSQLRMCSSPVPSRVTIGYGGLVPK